MSAPKKRDLRDKTIAFYWKGDAVATHEAMRADGYAVTVQQIRKVSSYQTFPGLLVSTLSRKPGVLSRQELQEFLSAVVRGEITDGWEWVEIKERIEAHEDDYIEAIGGVQFRKKATRVPKEASLHNRLKASEIFGRTIGAFTEQHTHEHLHTIKMADLMDEDLKHVFPIDVTPAKEELLSPSAALAPVMEEEAFIDPCS